jgi:xanthine dehydrogenase FAD-binding subunit
MFDIKEYKKANSIKDAIELLIKNPNAKLIAGGTDVLIRLREGHFEFSELIDIHELKQLKRIENDNGNIIIGSGVTFTEITESDIIVKYIPVIAKAASTVGGPQVRNVATIGGNICNGAVSADSAASLFVLDAELVIEGVKGERLQKITEFYLGPGKVDLKHDEILKYILIKPENYENFGMHYYKYAMRNAMDIATIGCAVACKLIGNKIENLKMAFTVAAPTPVRILNVENFAKNKNISVELIDEIAKLTLKDVKPRSSWRASKEFRLHIIETLAKRVIMEAVRNAGGKI